MVQIKVLYDSLLFASQTALHAFQKGKLLIVWIRDGVFFDDMCNPMTLLLYLGVIEGEVCSSNKSL